MPVTLDPDGQEQGTGPPKKDPLAAMLQAERFQEVLKRYRLEHLDYEQVKALHRALGEVL